MEESRQPPDTVSRKSSDGASPPPEKPETEASPEDVSSAGLAQIYDSGKPPSLPNEEPLAGEGDEGPNELGGKMTFLEHLDELRRRIMFSLIALIVAFAFSWIFHGMIFDFLRVPIDAVVEDLYFTKPTEAFTIYLKVSFVAAIFLSVPVILSQVWLFIAPGLYRREKSYFLPFLICSTVLFLLGGTFAYYVVLPPALNFLILEFGRDFTAIITAMEFFDFELIIIIGMGAIFQLPILVAFLSIFGLVTPRFLWRNFRYAFLLIVIVAAVVSPTTDPFNLFIWTGPMVVLYMISIAVAWVFKRRRARGLRGESFGERKRTTKRKKEKAQGEDGD